VAFANVGYESEDEDHECRGRGVDVQLPGIGPVTVGAEADPNEDAKPECADGRDVAHEEG
jgi:hypothetical protein